MLNLVSCMATLRTVHNGNLVHFHHQGYHNHAKPHPIRPDIASKLCFEEIVRIAPEVRPKALLVGTVTHDPVDKTHVMLASLGYMASH